jgi:hypothetical protein
VASITIDRIAAVQAHISNAVVQTTARSTLPVQQQDQLLAQSCAEACDLLDDWLKSGWWTGLAPADGGLVAECGVSGQEFENLLNSMFTDAMARAGRQGVEVPPDLVKEARTAVADIGRRYRKMSRSDLFKVASNRVTELKRAVCELAGEFRRGTQDAAKRRKAKTALLKTKNLLHHLAIVVTAPQTVVRNLTQLAQTIMITGIAQTAQPGLTIRPPGLGPTVH